MVTAPSVGVGQINRQRFSRFEANGDNRKQYNNFLELDTGTMPILRRAPSLTQKHRQSSLMAKILSYTRIPCRSAWDSGSPRVGQFSGSGGEDNGNIGEHRQRSAG